MVLDLSLSLSDFIFFHPFHSSLCSPTPSPTRPIPLFPNSLPFPISFRSLLRVYPFFSSQLLPFTLLYPSSPFPLIPSPLTLIFMGVSIVLGLVLASRVCLPGPLHLSPFPSTTCAFLLYSPSIPCLTPQPSPTPPSSFSLHPDHRASFPVLSPFPFLSHSPFLPMFTFVHPAFYCSPSQPVFPLFCSCSSPFLLLNPAHLVPSFVQTL